MDVLLIDRIGKDISGTGLDTNVVGRKFDDHKAVEEEFAQSPADCRSGTFPADRTATPSGWGSPSSAKRSLLRETDFAGDPAQRDHGQPPLRRDAPLGLRHGPRNPRRGPEPIGLGEPPEARLLWIRNTLDLTEVECSSAYREQTRRRDDLEILTGLRPLPLDPAGNLPEMSAIGSHSC